MSKWQIDYRDLSGNILDMEIVESKDLKETVESKVPSEYPIADCFPFRDRDEENKTND